MLHSYFEEKPKLTVFDKETAIESGASIMYQSNNEILLLPLGVSHPDISYYADKAEQKITLAGTFSGNANILNGRELKVDSVADGFVRINTSGMGFPEADFEITATNAFILSDVSSSVEAFFEGANTAPQGSTINFNNKRIVLREKPDVAHSYDNDAIKALTAIKFDDINITKTVSGESIFENDLEITYSVNGNNVSLDVNWQGIATSDSTNISFLVDGMMGVLDNISATVANGLTTSAEIASDLHSRLPISFTDGGVTYTKADTVNETAIEYTASGGTSIFNNIENQIATTRVRTY